MLFLYLLGCTKEPAASSQEGSAPPSAAPVAFADFRPTSVVWINVDTLRADRLSAYGHPVETMPLFQARASNQLIFDARTTAAWTPTSVPSQFTGKEIHEHGIQGIVGLPYQEVDGELIQQWMAGNGFKTAYFSSNYILESTSVVEGWDVYERMMAEWSSSVLVDRAEEWLDTLEQDEPFFLVLQPMDVHNPWSPPPEFQGLYADYSELIFPITFDAEAQNEAIEGYYATESEEHRALLANQLHQVYDEEIVGLDASIHRLLQNLDAQGRLQNTLVIFTGDHGESMYDAPFAFMHGSTLRQEIINVPLIFYNPSVVGESHVGSECIASMLDVWPTIAGRLGLAVPEGLTGVDLAETCRTMARAELFEQATDEYQLSEVVAVTSTTRLEHHCDTGSQYSFLLSQDPLGLFPQVGVTAETEALKPYLDEAISVILDRWDDEKCLGYSR